MTKKMTKAARAETKRISGASIPSADPDDFLLVEDPLHLLFDDRVHLPLQEALTLSIMTHGVLDAVTVVRDGTDLLVCDGRQRVKNAREANRRLRAAGSLPVKVPYVCKRGTDGKILGVMASSFIRTEDSPTSRARKMLKHVEIGRTTDEIAIDFGCSGKTVRDTLALLDCAPVVQKAVDAGEIAAKVAKTLSTLPRAQQTEALAGMRAAGETKGKRGVVAAEKASGKPAAARRVTLPHREILALRMRLEAQRISDAPPYELALEILRFVLGEDEAFATKHPWHAGRSVPPSKEANGCSAHPTASLLAGGRP